MGMDGDLMTFETAIWQHDLLKHLKEMRMKDEDGTQRFPLPSCLSLEV